MASIYVDEDNRANIVCPGCGKSRLVDASKYMHMDGPVKIKYRFKCSYCAQKQKKLQSSDHAEEITHTRIVTLERRKFYRKKVNLPGTFTDQRGKKSEMVISDLSRTGLKFKLHYPWPLKPEERITVEFHLDNTSKILIIKDSQVRKIDDLLISVEFLSINSYSEADKAIGFYLMN